MADKVKVPPEAFKQRPPVVSTSMSHRQQDKLLKQSGLVYMLDRCYPKVSSQHN